MSDIPTNAASKAMDTAAAIGKEYKFGFHEPEKHAFRTKIGLSRETVAEISEQKNEPSWMRDFRLQALDIFLKKPMPNWGGDLSRIDFDNLTYYLRPTEQQYNTWEMVPEEIKRTYDKLGIPEDERKFLGGVGAQYDSEVVYHNLKSKWEEQGVIFLSPEDAMQKHPDLVKEYFGTIVPPADNKFAALNSAVWSGGSFIYVPKGVKVDIPLQAYFRINAKSMGQFERTLIIVDEGAFVHYVEGCTAPVYSADSLHSAVVEIIVKAGARCRYTTIQNWSTNVYNLVTKRAVAYRDSTMEWIDGNIGSKLTMKYPAVVMLEPGARGEILSIAFAGAGQHLDAGAKVVHCASHTSSLITNKSISRNGGRTSYRGLCKMKSGVEDCKSRVVCDALLLDETSRSDTYPYIETNSSKISVEHEASVSKISEEQLFYLMSRGLTKDEAAKMIVTGFIEPLIRELPMEYAVEMNRLIELEMEEAVG
ncbi:MAG: Fe-S cluster assembly protein SufB [Planctomycetota bacterium]